jgi:concentrative nucleoside transporter, CNT family
MVRSSRISPTSSVSLPIRPTVIVGLFVQQAIAMFVLKSGAGFSIFKWIALLASDFLAQALQGAAFFFSTDVINLHWFFVNTVSAFSVSMLTVI